MAVIEFSAKAGKEEKLEQISAYLQELKNAFAAVVDEFEETAETKDDKAQIEVLVGALEALDDAQDDIDDVLTDFF